MMNIGIYYFTRTGNCKRIAGKIAGHLHLHPYAIEDDVDWNKIKAYFKSLAAGLTVVLTTFNFYFFIFHII